MRSTSSPGGPDPHPLAVAVIGAGPAGLMAAEAIGRAGLAVTVYDRMPTAGRKFLMAGRGGLNLTHSEALGPFLARYGEAEPMLRSAVTAFDPAHLRAWSAGLGEPTMVGSSGRVFPASFKASPLLRAWLRRLAALGTVFRFRHDWTGWTPEGALRFLAPEGQLVVPAAATVLALGGASWPRLGSDGHWTALLSGAGIAVAPLRPANCGFTAAWSAAMGERFAGAPLKNIALSFEGTRVRGDAIVTARGLEGGAVYALSARLRDAIAAAGEATVQLALRPDLTPAEIARRLAAQPAKASLSTALRKALGLPPVAVALVQEARHGAQGTTPVADLVNALRVRLIAPDTMARAISTAGGIPFAEVDDALMLRRLPGTFVAGEMLDWEAPTGGYLLQACFATGAAAGQGVVRRLTSPADSLPRSSA